MNRPGRSYKRWVEVDTHPPPPTSLRGTSTLKVMCLSTGLHIYLEGRSRDGGGRRNVSAGAKGLGSLMMERDEATGSTGEDKARAEVLIIGNGPDSGEL